MLKQESREYFKNLIFQNLQKSLSVPFNAYPPVTQKAVHEVVDALAIGCTITRPRTFGGKEMTAKEFQAIAAVFDETKCSIAVDALHRNKDYVKSRCWYILGVLARSNRT